MAVDVRAAEMRLLLAGDDTEIDLAALQGMWHEAQYLKLTDQTNRLIEFTDGYVEVMPTPTRKHQTILALLYELFVAFVRPRGGKVLFAPLRLRVAAGRFREPDLVVLLDAADPRNQEAFWLGADLVVEIVSPDNPERDTKVKRADYALGGIPEYWIADPEDETITVLKLVRRSYREFGVFRRGETAQSALLPDFTIAVSAIFDAE
jgi:Uma2 family endonuclease